MEKVLGIILRLSKVLNDIAGAALTFMMSITVADVLLRAGGHPIIGTYEIVALSGAVVIGFAIPLTSWNRGHVYMEFLLDRLSAQNKNILNTLTRVFCIILFVFIAVKLFQIGSEFHASGEVSPTIKIPFYPVVYAVGLCCVVECVVFVCDIVKIWERKYE
jgi:TRAP-type C4-dicarboxylate transport system permease small subunit